jgi:hypothetical protein
MRPYFRNHDGRTTEYGLGQAHGTVVKAKEALSLVTAEIKKVIACFESRD